MNCESRQKAALLSLGDKRLPEEKKNIKYNRKKKYEKKQLGNRKTNKRSQRSHGGRGRNRSRDIQAVLCRSSNARCILYWRIDMKLGLVTARIQRHGECLLARCASDLVLAHHLEHWCANICCLFLLTPLLFSLATSLFCFFLCNGRLLDRKQNKFFSLYVQVYMYV